MERLTIQMGIFQLGDRCLNWFGVLCWTPPLHEAPYSCSKMAASIFPSKLSAETCSFGLVIKSGFNLGSSQRPWRLLGSEKKKNGFAFLHHFGFHKHVCRYVSFLFSWCAFACLRPALDVKMPVITFVMRQAAQRARAGRWIIKETMRWWDISTIALTNVIPLSRETHRHRRAWQKSTVTSSSPTRNRFDPDCRHCIWQYPE